MKKNLAALAMVGLLTVSMGSVSVPASDSVVETTNMTITFDEETAPYTGAWLTFEESDFAVYLPEDWNIAELTEEDKEDGAFFVAYDEDTDMFFGISQVELEEELSLEQFADALTDSDYASTVSFGTVNGIDAVLYDSSDFALSGMFFIDEEGRAYMIEVELGDSDDALDVATAILSSISNAEDVVTDDDAV